jgi:hypothetical protein
LLTVRAICFKANVAVTATSPDRRFTEQESSLPVQPPPDQPVKVELVAGVAVRTTGLVVNDRLQVFPQFSPFGSEATVPVPVPPLVTVSVELTQAPVLHSGVGQAHATGAPHRPLAEQVSTELPEPGEHRTEAGVQTSLVSTELSMPLSTIGTSG